MKMKVATSLNTLLLILVVGCGTQTAPPSNSKSETEISGDAHSHGSGPHGGTIADWGGGAFHIEFTVDHNKKEATVYILGGDAETPAPVRAEKLLLSIAEPSFQLELLPAPIQGDAEGLSSRFVGKHDALGKVQEFSGTISGEVDGKPYAGDFVEQP